jgi:hypothetical protein
MGTVDVPSGVIEASHPLSDLGSEIGWEILSTVRLDADGVGGQETYALIRSVFGPDSIEAPDLYANNHPGVPHIHEDTDGEDGHHFVFTIHRDMDWDRDTYPTTSDRQRNEIKTYEGSVETLKALEAETFLITWKFKITAGMPVSKNFSHFFQMKGVGGDEQQPLLTITGAKKGGTDVLEIRHSAASGTADEILATAPWSEAQGQWIQASCRATFADQGTLALTLTTADGRALIALERIDLDLWRAGNFIRPKWGIYRSLADPTNLRADEETVRFAAFAVSKVRARP